MTQKVVSQWCLGSSEVTASASRPFKANDQAYVNGSSHNAEGGAQAQAALHTLPFALQWCPSSAGEKVPLLMGKRVGMDGEQKGPRKAWDGCTSVNFCSLSPAAVLL